MATKSKGPATPSAQRLAMLPFWEQMDAVLGGTAAMRAAGRKYLAQHPGEPNERYWKRLQGSTLWNQLELTLGGWVGRPFRDPLELNDDVPQEVQALEDDIDRQGTNLDAFCRKWFRIGLAKSFCHVLIEQPELLSRDGQRPTLADQREQKIRPYWSLIEPDAVIAARADVIDGVETLTHLRIGERTLEIDPKDEFSEVEVQRIRVYDRREEQSGASIYVTVWRFDKMRRRGENSGWYIEKDPVKIGVDFIPLVTFYSNREGFMLGKSPLQDLSDLNVKHWNSQSDQDEILRIARFPILAGSGVEDLEGNDPQRGGGGGARMSDRSGSVIGPHTVLISENPQSKFYYVEHSGNAIGTGQQALDHLEKQMSGYGSEFLKKSPDRQTATARTLDSLESISPLQGIVLDFKDAVQRALVVTAKWMGLELADTDVESESAGTVKIVTEFGPEDVSGHDLSALQNARKMGDISRKRFLKEMVRRGLLAADFDEDKNEEELEQEALSMTATPPSGTDLDPPVETPAPPEPSPEE